jgi:DNA-binding cell septation regulator SpoVG
VAHPLNQETRQMIEARIIEEFNKVSTGISIQPQTTTSLEEFA